MSYRLSSLALGLKISPMDEKTVPLDRYQIPFNRGAVQQANHWGDDLHYRALFDQTSECVFIIGLDFRYLAANQQALMLLGYEEHELVGMPVSGVMSQDDSLGHESMFVDDESNLYERILKRKDGRMVPVEISTSVVYDQFSRPAYIQSIARDISDRKHAEAILKRHTQILSVIGAAAAHLLRSSRIEIKIPEVLESLGQAMDVSCCTIFEIDTFSGAPCIEVRFQWHKFAGIAFDLAGAIEPYTEGLLGLRSGYFSSIEDHPGPASPHGTFIAIPINENSSLRGYLGFFIADDSQPWSPVDIDAAHAAANLIGSALQRNRYEETIRLNETRNRIILEALPDLLIRIDWTGNILDYSAKPDHPLYIQRDMITGKKFSQIWPADTVRQILGSANQNSFVATNYLAEFRLPYSNHAYEARLHPISASEALIVIRDVTEQARLNEMKSDFINRASHELRTPLTAAILMTELIQEGGTPEELDEYWRTLSSELNRQKILIDRLLIAGRLESGMMKMEIGPLELVPVLEESLIAVKPIASKGKVALQLAPPGHPLQVIGDKSSLQQVFINLINNAVKFSPQGGTVTVKVSADEQYVRVAIVDSGVGIPDQAIPHLFERFYRAKNVTIAEIPGSGIGLYIVKSILDELGGTIHVESALNQGTTFIVSLKRAAGSPALLSSDLPRAG